MTIKKLPSSERPYEKMIMYGADKLSNSELLAIIIKNGTKEKTAIELAKSVLSLRSETNQSMRFLQDVSIDELTKIKGIGQVKAIQLKAICELTKRISKPIEDEKIKLRTPNDVADLLMDELKFEKREKIKELILNSKNILIKLVEISSGGTDFAMFEPKDILTEAIKINEPRIIMVHNHPSGDPTPSLNDIISTKRLLNAADIVGVQILDHIIIGDR